MKKLIKATAEKKVNEIKFKKKKKKKLFSIDFIAINCILPKKSHP